jgi:hypothetical protein
VAIEVDDGSVGTVLSFDAGTSDAACPAECAATPSVRNMATTSNAQTTSMRRRRARRTRRCTWMNASSVSHASPLARNSAPLSSSS